MRGARRTRCSTGTSSDRGGASGRCVDSTVGHRQANRRTALSLAAKHLHDEHATFVSDDHWIAEVTGLAERLLPWLNADLPTEGAYVAPNAPNNDGIFDPRTAT